MFQKRIDTEKCVSCMKCETICTNSRVIAKNSDGYPEFRNNQRCIYCGHCLAICPQEAITFEYVPSDTQSVNVRIAETKKLDQAVEAPDENSLLEFLYSTRTNRFFLDKPVDREKLNKIIETMMRAPSAGNEQNRDYIILDKKEKIDKLEQLVKNYFDKTMNAYKNPALARILSFLGAISPSGPEQLRKSPTSGMSFKQRSQYILKLMQEDVFPEGSAFSYLRNAGAIIIVTSSRTGGAMHKPFYRGDAAISATYGILAAKAIGLASCWMGLLQIAAEQDEGIRGFLGIGKADRFNAAIAIGYSDLKWIQTPPRGPAKVVWL